MPPTTPPPIKRRRIHSEIRGEGPPPRSPEPAGTVPQDPPLYEVFWEQLNGNEGAGYALSFVVHAVFLAILAIPVIRHLQPETGFTTIVQSESEDHVVFDAPIDTHIPLPAVENAGGDELQSQLLDPFTDEAQVVPELKLADTSSILGNAEAGGDGQDGGGIRIAEPKNAIRAGNFSVWPWPIQAYRLRGQVVHGKPGASPKALQDYSIVIRVRVPRTMKTISLHDFSGMVVGTDGYRQKIPEDAWFFDTRGNLIRARTGRKIPVINGTAELLIRVPGAASAEVKDSITVRSRTLDEEQKIELIFQSRDN